MTDEVAPNTSPTDVDGLSDRQLLPGDLDASMSLDEVARRRPMARALLLVDLLAKRRVPIDLPDRLDRVGDVIDLQHDHDGGDEGGAQHSRWPLSTPRATLRAVAPCDFASIHAALNDPSTSWRLPTRGATVLPVVAQQMVEGADLQMVGASNRHPTTPVAMMALNGYDPVAKVAELTIIGLERDPARATHRPHRALRFETAAMFVGYSFSRLNLDRITASVPDYNWHYFADGEDLIFRHEGVLEGEMLAGGRRWDVHQIAILREEWTAFESRIVRALERFVPDG